MSFLNDPKLDKEFYIAILSNIFLTIAISNLLQFTFAEFFVLKIDK